MRIGLAGAVLCLLAASSYGIVRLAYGVRPAFIHVRWAPSIREADRRSVAERYGLTNEAVHKDRTFTYYLADLSRTNIESLVRDPAIEDTQHINRELFLIRPTASRGPYAGWGAPLLPLAFEGITVLLLATGLGLLGLCVVEPWLPAAVRARLRRASLRRWLEATRLTYSSEFAAAFAASVRPTVQSAAGGSSHDLRTTGFILFASLSAIAATTSIAGTSPSSAAGGLAIVYACGYVVGSLLVDRIDQAPGLTWAVIRMVAGLLLSAIGFLLSLVLGLPWFVVPVALVALAVYVGGLRALSWPNVEIRFNWDSVAAGIAAVVVLSPIALSVLAMAPGTFPPVFYNVDTAYFMEKVHALVATNTYPPMSLSNVGGARTYHFATHAMAALVSRGSGLLPHHALFVIVLPLLIAGLVAAAVAVARHVSPAVPRSIAVPLMLISGGIFSNEGQNIGGDFLILSSIAAVAAAPSVGWRLPVFLIGTSFLVKTSTGLALLAGFAFAETWRNVRVGRLRPSPQVLTVGALFIATYIVFYVSTSVEPDFVVELFPLFHLRQLAERGRVVGFTSDILRMLMPAVIVGIARITDPEARSTPLLAWAIAPLLVVNATRMIDVRAGGGGADDDWLQILHAMPFLLHAFSLSVASRRWDRLGYPLRAVVLLAIGWAVVPVVATATQYSVRLLRDPASGHDFVDNRSLAEALAVIPTRGTLIVTNDLRYPANDFGRHERQMQIPALFGHQAFAVNYSYEQYPFSDERRELQRLLEQPEWLGAISDAARAYHWTHLVIRKDHVHPDPIPLEQVFANQHYAVFRFP